MWGMILGALARVPKGPKGPKGLTGVQQAVERTEHYPGWPTSTGWNLARALAKVHPG